MHVAYLKRPIRSHAENAAYFGDEPLMSLVLITWREKESIEAYLKILLKKCLELAILNFFLGINFRELV